jgi:NAD(P)H-hydrate epimerase
MARLLHTDTDTVQADRPAAVAALVERTGAVVVLKGHRTLIGAPGEVTVVNPTGNPGMATGGTGDVLTGVIAALVGQGMAPFEAAWFGVWTHGLAGDLAALDCGETALVAGDLIEWLPEALQDPSGGGNA